MSSSGSEEEFVKLGNLNFHVLHWSRNSSKLPIVLVHGFNQTAHSWDEAAARLSKRFWCIALDQRGHGDSQRAPDGDYSRATAANDIRLLFDKYGLDRAAVIGMSMGAMNSVEFAVRHPERVSALVIVDNTPEVQPEGVAKIRQLAAAEWDSFDVAVDRIHQFNPRRTRENIVDRLRHSLAQSPDGRWRWKFDPAYETRFQQASAEGSEPAWQNVRRLRCPTLLVHGADSDVISPEAAQKTAAAIPNCRLATIAGAGHSVAGDQPAAFTDAVLQFLEEKYVPTAPARL